MRPTPSDAARQGTESENHAQAPDAAAAPDVIATPDVTTAPDVVEAPESCQWSQCEVAPAQPLTCAGADEICDAFRNRCVATCEGNTCCDGVRCPEGSACVPAVGRCGAPAGTGCFDMGTLWWTGRDLPPDRRAAPDRPTATTFEIHNDGADPIYFVSIRGLAARFSLYYAQCGHQQPLWLPETKECSNPCPSQGPAQELDCSDRPPVAQRLPAGEHLSVTWSGREEVSNWRICDRPRGGYCHVMRNSLPGRYTVELCAYTGIDGGQPDPADPNRLTQASPAGEPRCRRVELQHPSAAPVMIRFGG